MKRQSVLVIGLLLVATAAFAGLHTRSGWVYIQNSQWSEAVRELKLAIAEDPKDDKAQFGLGVAYASMDSVAAAYKHFTITKELDPKKAKDCDNNIQSLYAKHYQAGQKHFAGQNMQGAAHEFELATLASPKQSAGRPRLGRRGPWGPPGHSCYVPVPQRHFRQVPVASGTFPLWAGGPQAPI